MNLEEFYIQHWLYIWLVLIVIVAFLGIVNLIYLNVIIDFIISFRQ